MSKHKQGVLCDSDRLDRKVIFFLVDAVIEVSPDMYWYLRYEGKRAPCEQQLCQCLSDNAWLAGGQTLLCC